MYSRDVTSIGRARREFRRKESPWTIGAGILALVIARILVGDPSWRDAVAVAAMLAVYPFGEWAIHVYLLHAKPINIRGRNLETVAARAHRAHHGDPNDLDMVLLYWWQAAFLMLVAVPFGRARRAARDAPRRSGSARRAAQRRDRRLLHGLHLRVDPLPDPHRIPAEIRRLHEDLAKPPPPPLQERALLARHHQQPERSRPWDQP
jgi:hypothetical protein